MAFVFVVVRESLERGESRVTDEKSEIPCTSLSCDRFQYPTNYKSTLHLAYQVPTNHPLAIKPVLGAMRMHYHLMTNGGIVNAI